jgi:hypothetical protein
MIIEARQICCSIMMTALLCSVAILPSAAQTTGFPVLRLGPFAEHAALGETYTAYVRGSASMHGNPAGLAAPGWNSATVTYQSWIAATDIYGASARFRVTDRSGLGVSITMFDSGDLEARDQPGPGDPFAVQYVSLGAGYAVQFGPVRAGASAKFLSERIYTESATGFAFDAGVQATFFDDYLMFGASVHNLGSMDELGVEATPLPTIIRIGAAGYPIRLYSEGDAEPTIRAFLSPEIVISPDDEDARFHIGAGAEIPDLLAVRAGYLSGDTVRNFTFGAGITYSGFVFDYGFLPLRDGFGGPSHILTLRYEW